MKTRRYDLVVFDMDGTLIEDSLDFVAIREEIGLAPAQLVLEGILALGEIEQARAWEILARHEAEAAARVKALEGAGELLAGLVGRGHKIALLTRNSRKSTETVLRRHGWAFDFVATRDEPPYKPDPESILRIVRQLGVAVERTLMVGDYIHDINAANAAGVESVLLCMRHGGKHPPFADRATYRVGGVREAWGVMVGEST